jgi:aspartokinase
MEGVTDALIELVTLAQTGKESYLASTDALRARHLNTLEALLRCERYQPVIEALDLDFKDMKAVLRGTYLSRTYSDRTLEFISGHGELWSGSS